MNDNFKYTRPFKGKRLDNQEWAFGFYNAFVNRETGEREYFIQTVEEDGSIGPIHKVDQRTLCQGIDTDKNGNPIYECDIVRHYTDYFDGDEESFVLRKVWWSQEYHSYLMTWPDKPSGTIVDTGVFEVVGNVYDNPELEEQWGKIHIGERQ